MNAILLLVVGVQHESVTLKLQEALTQVTFIDQVEDDLTEFVRIDFSVGSHIIVERLYKRHHLHDVFQLLLLVQLKLLKARLVLELVFRQVFVLLLEQLRVHLLQFQFGLGLLIVLYFLPLIPKLANERLEPIFDEPLKPLFWLVRSGTQNMRQSNLVNVYQIVHLESFN